MVGNGMPEQFGGHSFQSQGTSIVLQGGYGMLRQPHPQFAYFNGTLEIVV